jgi:hypothetical protein
VSKPDPIERRRGRLVFLLKELRRDLAGRRFTQTGEHQLLWHLTRAEAEVEAALAEANNGMLINAADAAEQGKQE